MNLILQLVFNKDLEIFTKILSLKIKRQENEFVTGSVFESAVLQFRSLCLKELYQVFIEFSLLLPQ